MHTQVTHVGFERFVALYTNHRPVFGIGKEQVAAAFDALQLGGGGGGGYGGGLGLGLGEG